MPITESSTATSGLPDVYFTPPAAIDALKAIGCEAVATDAPSAHDFVIGNPPFGAEMPASA